MRPIVHNKTIIATIGPSCESINLLLQMKRCGVEIFRVNMSHSSIKDLIKFAKIGKENNLRIGLDTEGGQMRTCLHDRNFINLNEGDKFKIRNSYDQFNDKDFVLYPDKTIDKLEKGFKIRFDFNGACAEVISKEKNYLDCLCLSSGLVGNNKGVDILNSNILLPDFTEKDIKSFDILESEGIKDVFISFCKSRDAIKKIKNINDDIFVTSKIESKASIHNLQSICQVSDALLIDRGDLTREINILDIPFAQRGIIKVANSHNKPCFIATNIFESLLNGNLPTRAEINDIVGTVEMGAAGLVLAAETAIGKKPLLCVEIIKELIHRYSLHKDGLLFADLDRNEITDEEMKLWLNRNYK